MEGEDDDYDFKFLAYFNSEYSLTLIIIQIILFVLLSFECMLYIVSHFFDTFLDIVKCSMAVFLLVEQFRMQ